MALAIYSARERSATTLSVALAEFQAGLSDERRARLLTLRSKPRAIDVLTFTAELDYANAARKRRGVASRFCSLLESVQQYAAVMDTYSQLHADITSLVWGSVKLCILVASNAASYYDKLSEWFMRLGTLCPRLAEWQSLYPDSRGLQKALDVFYAMLVRFCAQAVQVHDRTGSFNLVSSLWKPFELEFGAFVKELRQQKAEIDEEIRLASARVMVQEIEAGKRFRDAVTKSMNMRRGFHGPRNHMLQRSQSLCQKQQLLDRLSSYDYKAALKVYRKKRHGSTCSWLFPEPEYRQWLADKSSSFFWLSGGVGSGKSVLTGNAALSFFFCKENENDSLRARMILRSLMRQCLAAETDESSEDLHSQIASLLDEDDEDEQVMLEKLIRVTLRRFDTIFLVIDGWDACARSQRRAVLDALGSVIPAYEGVRKPRLKVFITNCDNASSVAPPAFTSYSLALGQKHVDADIATFVEETLQEKIREGVLLTGNAELVGDVKRALVAGANGMFLWVAFQMQDICEQTCDDDIRTAITSLPRGLRETYARILQRVVRSGRADIAAKVFRWASVARRPLKLKELRHAIAVQPGVQTQLSQERLANGFGSVAAWCGGLVALDEESGAVQFAHPSVKHFLLCSAHDDTDNNADDDAEVAAPKRFRVSLADAETDVGGACVTYLCFSDFESQLAKVAPRPRMAVDPTTLAALSLSHSSTAGRALVKPLQKFGKLRPAPGATTPDCLSRLALPDRSEASAAEQQKRRYPFLAYASQHWLAHTSRFTDNLPAWRHFRRLVLDDHHFATLAAATTQLSRPPGTHIPQQQQQQQLLKVIIDYNHTALVRCLQRWHPQQLAGHSSALFRAACARGLGSLAVLILDADDEAGCFANYGALDVAVASGLGDVVVRLVNIYQNSGARRQRLAQALHGAARCGQAGVVRQLLVEGADVDARLGATEIVDAESGDDKKRDLVRELEAGARGGETALEAAVNAGHVEIVEMLLRAGANAAGGPRAGSFDTWDEK